MNQLLKIRFFILPQCRLYSGPKKNFFGNIFDNLKKGIETDKDILENIEKFKKSKQELEDTEEFRKIRQIYKKMEEEIPKDAGEKLLGVCRNVMEKIQKETDEIKRTELLRKGIENISKTAESISSNVKVNEITKRIVKVAEVLEEELRSERSNMYQAPDVLKTRCEVAGKVNDQRIIHPNEDASGVVLHKDSRWLSTWNNFKENNPYVQKIFDLKTQMDESDSFTARSGRFVADKVSNIFSSFFTKSDIRTVLEEIVKVDSSFTVNGFTRFCQYEIIPNVLEAMMRGETVILKDWCYEGVYNMLITPINELKKLNYRQDYKIVDINHVEIVTGAMMDQGPMLLLSFECQQIICVKDAQGNVVQGNPNKCVLTRYHWALCRDQNELNPWAAWRLIDVASNSQELLF